MNYMKLFVYQNLNSVTQTPLISLKKKFNIEGVYVE